MNDNREAIKTIKKGFNNSIGWKGGKGPPMSIHLFEPLTSTPIKGTKTKHIKNKLNKTKQILNNLIFSKKEKIISINVAKKIKTKCLIKK